MNPINPFASQMGSPQFGAPPGAQPPAQSFAVPSPAPQGPQAWSQPGFPPPQQAPQGPQAWQQPPASPQGFAPPPAAPQAQGYGAPPAGYGPPAATAPGPQGFGPGASAGNPLAGVTESGGRLPMILQSGDYLLECLGNDILKQSNTVRFTFKIIESTCPNYPPGLDVQFIQKVKMPEGTWEWNIGASQILGTVRCLMGYAEEAAFRAVAGADDFALSVIRGVPQAALVGRRVRCASSPSGKIDTKRNQPFMNNSWRAA